VTTDGFLFPNRVLESRGLLTRKGFPESYDVRRLVDFVADVKAAQGAVRAPVYSHQSYDIVPGRFQVVDSPDIVIVEGLNVLQTGDALRGPGRRGQTDAQRARVFVSDFFDFSIYLDAEEAHIEHWYISRFLALRETVFKDPESYFHKYSGLSDTEAVDTAREIWRTINGVNLRENIAPTRERARLVLEKGPEHAVQRVRLRRF
jgi:type I pantothenate kinase